MNTRVDIRNLPFPSLEMPGRCLFQLCWTRSFSESNNPLYRWAGGQSHGNLARSSKTSEGEFDLDLR